MVTDEPGPDSAILGLLPKPMRHSLKVLGIKELTEPQRRAIPSIMRGENTLLIAPTGSGKTEAAMMPILSTMMESKKGGGISLLYITPLRALNRDMLRRLISWTSRFSLTVEVRHGDTPTKERRRQALKPPDILITTPETLQAILPGKRMQRNLKRLKWVVIDEVHEIAESKRGSQLSIALERLQKVVGKEFQRIGLSATVGTPEKVAELLVGNGRRVKTIHVHTKKGYRYWIRWPQPSEEDFELSTTLCTSPEAAARISTIKELSDLHLSTLIFVNSRQIAEMMSLRLNTIDPRIGIHHGSLSRQERENIEDSFKKGGTKAIVCTSTLELGIDIGTVDLVIQYLSPRQVGPLIQRVGRSGHKLGLTSEGVIITAFTDDAIEAIAVVERAEKELVEPTRIHEMALDVLAHQTVGLALDQGGIRIHDAFRVISRAYPFRFLKARKFRQFLDFLSGLWLVRIRGDIIMPTRRSRQFYFTNLSMIPDERRYPVVDLTSDRVIGIVGEEFVSIRARLGLHFICRGRVWNIEQISDDGQIYVTPIEDPRAALPGWDGEILPIPFDLANEVGGLRREIADRLKMEEAEKVAEYLRERFHLENYAAKSIIQEIQEQTRSGAAIPTDKTVLIEGFDRYLIINCCLGELANRALGYIIDQRLSERGLIRNWWADGYRILLELPIEVTELDFDHLAKGILPSSPEEAERDFASRMAARFPFGYYMKFIAERFGVIQRGLAMSEDRLLDLYRRYNKTPIYDETIREVLQEKVDLEAVKCLIEAAQEKRIRVVTHISKEKPTPISYHILNRFAELPEIISPEGMQGDSLERIRNTILHSEVELLCMNCGKRSEQKHICDLSERPSCSSCGSTLLGILPRYKKYVESIVEKRLKGERLVGAEPNLLAELRRSADIVHSYGRDGIFALSVYGIGPQTASRILSRMHYSQEELLKDLMEAKLKFIQTRPYWDSR